MHQRFVKAAVIILTLCPAVAAAAPCEPKAGYFTAYATCDWGAFIAAIARLITEVGVVGVVVYMVIAGFMFVSAQGNPEKLTTAKRHFMWSIVGAIGVMGTWAIINLLQQTAIQIVGQ